MNVSVIKMGGLGPGQRLNQDVTYWAPKALRNEANELTYENPILLKGFWYEDSREVRAPSGDMIISKAIVHVSDDVEITGWLALGDFVSGQSVFDPTSFSPSDDVVAYEIKDYAKRTDLRNMDYDREAIL